MKNRYNIAAIAAAALLAGCAVGPNFKSPAVSVPSGYMNDSIRVATSASEDSILNLAWWENFDDPLLTSLINSALDSNLNLRVAASRVEQSRLELQNARAALAPTVGVSLSGTGTQTPAMASPAQQYAIEPTLSWELDIFGKLRRMSQAAAAQLLATEQGYRAVRLALVAQVATTYFSLLQYDLALDISHSSYNLRRGEQVIIDSMVYYGASSAVALEQARSLTATAAAAIPQYERARNDAQNALCVLLGRNPYHIEVDGSLLLSGTVPEAVPAGLPTSLLDRRPDIMQAYYGVAESTANVGVAVANRYPSVTLTGSGGVLSSTLKGLFTGNPFGWSAGISIVEPLLAWGRNKRAVDIARQADIQAILTYKQSVISALSEVETALSAVATYRVEVEQNLMLLEATRSTQMLTRELYNNGSNTFLDVLDAERQFFSTQIGLSQILSDQLSSYVTLYKALGGGW